MHCTVVVVGGYGGMLERWVAGSIVADAKTGLCVDNVSVLCLFLGVWDRYWDSFVSDMYWVCVGFVLVCFFGVGLGWFGCTPNLDLSHRRLLAVCLWRLVPTVCAALDGGSTHDR